MKNTIIAIVSLVVLLAVCLFAYELIFKKPLVESPTNTETDLFTQTLNVKEQYKDGQFTFAGEVEVPTPCHTISADVSPSNSNTYMINVNTIPPKEGVGCVQMVTTRQFKVTFAAPADAIIKANVNGKEYTLNRFEIPADQDIDDYQLELKG